MIRGCQRKIIYVKDTKSPFFEEAYFVLRNNASVTAISEAEMFKEAVKIVDENLLDVYCSRANASKQRGENKNNKKHFEYASPMLFLAGVATSGLVCGAAMLLLFVI